MDVHNGLDLRVSFVNAGVYFHFGALGQSRSSRDEKSLGVAHHHIVRLHDRQGVELILSALDEKMVRL